MSNTNRDYAIVYDVKNSTLVLSRPLVFYITNKNTSNIIVRLVTKTNIGGGVDQYTDIEDASSYILLMRTIKPNDEVINIKATQREPESIFEFDLTEGFKDIPGTYICELMISTIVNERQELITSDLFTYEVKRSVLSKIDQIIEHEDTTVEKLLNELDATKAELSSLAKEKANKNEVFTMANMGQDIKEAMTGGSVAVVGKNAVLSDNIVDKQITHFKTDFVKTGFNILDIKKMTIGYVNSDGSVTYDTNYRTTEMLPVNGHDTLTLSRIKNGIIGKRTIRKACFFDANHNSLVDLYYDNVNKYEETVNIPSNAKYFKASFLAGYSDENTCLHFGSESKFEKFHYIVDHLNFDDSTLEILKNEIIYQLSTSNVIDYSNTKFLKNTSGNLLNVKTITSGFYIDENDAFIQGDGSYITTDFIHIHGNAYLTLWGNTDNTISPLNIRIANFYDKHMNHLKSERYDNVTNEKESISIPSNAYFVRLSMKKSLVSNSMLTLSNIAPTEIKPFIVENIYDNKLDNKLTGKTLFNFGDSIAAGDGNNGKGYAEILAEKHNMICYDFAVGGATLGETDSNNITNQVNRSLSNDIQPDYILINGGTNDIAEYNVPLGEITADYNSNNFDKSTTIGALEWILYTLKTNYPNSKIAFVSVHKMSSRDYSKQVERQNKCVEVCKKWSIPIIDIFNRGNLNTFLREHHKFTNPTTSQPNGDRTHPNQLGYETYYIPLIEEVLNNI